MDHVQDYSFVIERKADNCPGWNHPSSYLIIGVHKFVSVDAATNALMHAMRSFATDTLIIPIDRGNVDASTTRYTLDPHPAGFAIVQHTPGADGWILRGTPTETILVVGRVVLTLHVRPENMFNDSVDSLEKSLVIANSEKISLVQDLNDVRAQLRELSDAFYKLIRDKPVQLPAQAPVQENTPVQPIPVQTPAVPCTDALVAELCSFDRSNLLSRSQRDRKLQAKKEIPAKYDIVYDDVDICATNCNGEEYDTEEFFGDYVADDQYSVDMFEDIPECDQCEIPLYQSLELAPADLDSWDAESVDWIDDRVCSPRTSPIGTPVGSPKSTPISTPVRSPACSFDNGGELLWQRRYIPADIEGVSSSTSPRLPYPWSAPGYLDNVAFSDSTIRAARGILMKSPKYE